MKKKHTTSLEPTVLAGGAKTVVSLGTFKVTIYHEEEGGRHRHRLAWQMGGERQRRGVSTLAGAVAEAKRIISARVSGADALVQISPEKLRYYQDMEAALNVPLDVAVRYYNGQAPGSFEPLAVEELVDDYVAEMRVRNGRRGASPAWVQTVVLRGRHFAEAFPCMIHEITPEGLRDFIHQARWGERTQFNYQGIASMFFARALEKHALPPGDTAFDLFKPKIEKPVGAEKVVFTPADLEALLRAAVGHRPKLVPYLAIGAFGGVRAEEICRLRWGVHIDMEERAIRCTPDITKTGRRRIVDMGDALHAWLSVSPGRDGELVQPYRRLNAVLTYFWREVAGLPRWPRNGLRVSFVSYSMALTGNAAATANTAGHSEAMLQTTYKQIRGVTKDSAKKWFDILPASLISSHIPAAHPLHTGSPPRSECEADLKKHLTN